MPSCAKQIHWFGRQMLRTPRRRLESPQTHLDRLLHRYPLLILDGDYYRLRDHRDEPEAVGSDGSYFAIWIRPYAAIPEGLGLHHLPGEVERQGRPRRIGPPRVSSSLHQVQPWCSQT